MEVMVLTTAEVVPMRDTGSSTLLGEGRGGQRDGNSLPAHPQLFPPRQGAQGKLVFRWGSKLLHPPQFLNLEVFCPAVTTT